MFQFTHPGRGATRRQRTCHPRLGSFNSRTPGGVRQVLALVFSSREEVSIHAPREGCDTAITMSKIDTATVSIHAPREGCD